VRKHNREEEATVAAAPSLVPATISDDLRAILSKLNFGEEEVISAVEKIPEDVLAEEDADEVTQRVIKDNIAIGGRATRLSTRLATQIR